MKRFIGLITLLVSCGSNQGDGIEPVEGKMHLITLDTVPEEVLGFVPDTCATECRVIEVRGVRYFCGHGSYRNIAEYVGSATLYCSET